MVTFWERADHSVDHMFSFSFLLFVILVIPRFDFEGWIWVLVALVPVLCILFTLILLNKFYACRTCSHPETSDILGFKNEISKVAYSLGYNTSKRHQDQPPRLALSFVKFLL